MEYDNLVYIILAIIVIIIIIVLIWLSRNNVNQELMDSIEENTFPFKTYIINLDRKPERYKYITNQLNNLGLNNYERWSATDGFNVSDSIILRSGVGKELLDRGRGLAGCAASHMRLWKHIADNNLGWTLILEDDAHFHPQFVELFHRYWKLVPKNAKIIFPGWCAECNNNKDAIVDLGVMCLQGYMLCADTAKYLLNNLAQMTLPIDIIITEHFRWRSGSFIFNGNVVINGIRPNDYKDKNKRKCMFDGIIYQNQQEQGSTIHTIDTIY